jgi:2,3-bisphosphoglycerate-independent phosphoglycerate mutase
MGDAVTHYDEESVQEGSFGILKGSEFMKAFLSGD